MSTAELLTNPLKNDEFRRFLIGPYTQILINMLEERKTLLFRKVERPSADQDVIALVNRIQGASDALDFIRTLVSEAKKEFSHGSQP
jgi:hypothetical protein